METGHWNLLVARIVAAQQSRPPALLVCAAMPCIGQCLACSSCCMQGVLGTDDVPGDAAAVLR